MMQLIGKKMEPTNTSAKSSIIRKTSAVSNKTKLRARIEPDW